MCGAMETELWLERQLAKELRCKHHQIVYTSSAALRIFWRWNRKLFTNLYFRAAWHSLRELLADTRWLGALPGVTAVFQSWSDELGEHLHLHFIVTSGGISPAGKWIDADPEMLIPFPVLAALFRGKFIAYLREPLNQARAHFGQAPHEPINRTARCSRTAPPHDAGLHRRPVPQVPCTIGHRLCDSSQPIPATGGCRMKPLPLKKQNDVSHYEVAMSARGISEVQAVSKLKNAGRENPITGMSNKGIEQKNPVDRLIDEF